MRLIFMIMPHHRRLAVLLAALALFAVVVLQCEPGPAESSAAESTIILAGKAAAEPTFSGTLDQGAIGSPIQVYRASCSACHDSDGRGGLVRDDTPTIPDFTDAKWHASRSDAELSRSILEGKGKSMPRMKKKLGSVDVKQMVLFVRGFRGGKQVVDDEPEAPAAPEQSTAGARSTAVRSQSLDRSPATHKDQNNRDGSRLFQRFCARCHEQGGKGTAMRESVPTIPDFTRPEWHNSRKDAQLRVSILGGKGTDMPAFRGKVEPEQVPGLVALIRSLGPTRPGKAPAASNEIDEELQKLYKEFEELRALRKKLADDPAKTAAPQEAGPPESASSRPD
jgi:mono/diheme cytochrome c family protein